MNPNEDKPVDSARNFRWVDQNTIIFVNREGIEKMMEVVFTAIERVEKGKVVLHLCFIDNFYNFEIVELLADLFDKGFIILQRSPQHLRLVE